MMRGPKLGRRTFLTGAAAGAAALGFPAVLRAQPKTVKIGVIHTLTGPLAEPGQAVPWVVAGVEGVSVEYDDFHGAPCHVAV